MSALTWRPFGRRRPVLSDLSLSIPAGQRVLLVGPSGSGKSTLLRAIAGLLETADAGQLAGTVTVDGSPPGARTGDVGLVLQEPGAGVVAATVRRDVAFGLENAGMPREQMPAAITSALAAVGLRMPPDTPTHALSGGETQRLALAGALALQPAVLLLDEPTAMLDPEHAAQVRAAVGQVTAATGLTTVVVEHVLGPWVDLVDRVVVLDADGQALADGPVHDVLRAERERLLELGIWVPGARPPTPLSIPAGVLREPAQRTSPAPLRASALRVDRRSTGTDGVSRTVPALHLPEPLAPVPGTSTAVIGPSGSGKSTLVLALAGFVEPSRGDVVAGEERVADLDTSDLARLLAWVPQWSSSTIVAATVLEEVLATSRAVGADGPGRRERALGLLAALRLDHLAQADPRELSGGEQRRLALAAAVLHGPAVLLADEPTVGQDRHTWAAVAGIIDGYREAGGAAVLATHDTALTDRADEVRALAAPSEPPPPERPRRPLVGRAGPLALFAGAALAVPAGVLSPGWSASLLVLGAQLLLTVVGLLAPGHGARPTGRARRFLLRLAPGALAALSVGWSTWLLGGHDPELGLTAALRVLVIVLPSALLIPYVDPDALGDHVGQRLRLPARPVVAVAAALQRVQTFGETWTEISRARRVRGLGVRLRSPRSVAAYLKALTLGLLVRSLRLAADLATAMDARGFAGAGRRTWFAPAPWHLADTVVVIAAAGPLVVALLAGVG